MSWTHYSKSAILGVLLAVSLLAVGTAAAVTITGESPGATQVGEQVEMSITIQQPFEDAPDQWTLRGETGLNNASWTVETLEQGRTIDTNQYGSQTFEQDLNIDSGTTEIQITVQGTVPEISQYNYDDMSVENVTVASIGSVTDGSVSELKTWQIHRYTEQSRQARQAIAAAEEAAADVSNQEVQGLIDDAKAFYSNEEFQRAIDNAEQAQQRAEQASSGLPIVPIAIGVVVLIALVAGGLYYRKQQQSGYKLQ